MIASVVLETPIEVETISVVVVVVSSAVVVSLPSEEDVISEVELDDVIEREVEVDVDESVSFGACHLTHIYQNSNVTCN